MTVAEMRGVLAEPPIVKEAVVVHLRIDADPDAPPASSESVSPSSPSVSLSPRLHAKRRLHRSVLILLTLFHMRMTLMQMDMPDCSMLPDPTLTLFHPSDGDAIAPVAYSLYLVADGRTRCYIGAHLVLSMQAGILLHA
jgi:hypothetical protein